MTRTKLQDPVSCGDRFSFLTWEMAPQIPFREISYLYALLKIWRFLLMQCLIGCNDDTDDRDQYRDN